MVVCDRPAVLSRNRPALPTRAGFNRERTIRQWGKYPSHGSASLFLTLVYRDFVGNWQFLGIVAMGVTVEIACAETTQARPHQGAGNGDHRMDNSQGSRGGWIDGRERDWQMAYPSRERVRGRHRLGCTGTLAALARRAMIRRCIACTTFAAGFVVMFVWG